MKKLKRPQVIKRADSLIDRQASVLVTLNQIADALDCMADHQNVEVGADRQLNRQLKREAKKIRARVAAYLKLDRQLEELIKEAKKEGKKK